MPKKARLKFWGSAFRLFLPPTAVEEAVDRGRIIPAAFLAASAGVSEWRTRGQVRLLSPASYSEAVERGSRVLRLDSRELLDWLRERGFGIYRVVDHDADALHIARAGWWSNWAGDRESLPPSIQKYHSASIRRSI